MQGAIFTAPIALTPVGAALHTGRAYSGGQQAAGLPAEALKEHEAHHAAVRDLVEEEDWEAAATSGQTGRRSG